MRWLLVLLVGCGWSEKKFEVEGIARLCDAAASCAGYYESADCYDVLRATDRSSCDYDPKSARACVNALEEASCTQVGTSLDLQELVVPEDCLAVYDCEWIDLSAL